MAHVTICIPAYKAGDFIHHTVASALQQTYRDIKVAVAIEPPGEDEIAALQRFSSDPRLHISVNPARLGWASNIASILRTIDTPYFMVLPHDDLIHPEYVSALLPHLEADPAVSVAYGDIHLLTEGAVKRRMQVLSEGDACQRALSFFAAGGEAPPWRGVTRSAVLEQICFPEDGFQGFLVECEWALQLILAGIAKRVPRALYCKRWVPSRTEHASHTRNQVSGETIREALFDHRLRLRAHANRSLLPNDSPIVSAAIDTVIAKRALYCLSAQRAWEFLDLMNSSLRAAQFEAYPEALTIAANGLVVRALFKRSMNEDDKALALATEALAIDPTNRDALVLQAEIYSNQNQPLQALWAATAAFDATPNAIEFEDLFERLHRDVQREVNSTVKRAA